MMTEFNIFKWQVDPDYKKEVKKRVEEDEKYADHILDMLVSIGEEIGIPFEFEKPEPVKTRPKVWVDKGRGTWDSKDTGWSTKA